jgi:hypothetical protein
MANQISTFWELINAHQIEIPPIQRDYAQGRSNSKSKEIRKSFVKHIEETLSNPNGKQMHLNFVYGKINGKINAQKIKENQEAVESMLNAVKTYSQNLELDIKWDFTKQEINEQSSELTSFAPLDGQQRLTTLYLLHWYLMPNSDGFKSLLRKFSYKIRPSSKDFCQALVENKFDPKEFIGKSIKAHIKNSPWFFDYWNNDPTVRGMLRMLDEIHAVFVKSDFEAFWNKLVEQKVIYFDFLDLDNYKLTDELYVKMNARGVPLTPFENFKAWLIEYIQDEQITISPLVNKKGGEKSWVELLDTNWTDLFWANKDEDNMLIDEELMRYFRNMMQIFLVQKDDFKPENDSKKDKTDPINIKAEKQRELAARLATTKKDNGEYDYVPSTFFTDNDLLNPVNINELFTSINNISNNIDALNAIHLMFQPVEQFKTKVKGKKHEGQLLKRFITGEMSYTDKVVYYALHLYLKQTKAYNEESLKAWIRVVRNLAENSTIDSIPRFKNAIISIKSLSNNCDKIYEYLNTNSDLKLTGIDGKQIKEEAKKAILILEDSKWEKSFTKYENHPYFKGQIAFLLIIAGNINDDLSIPTFEDYADKMGAIFISKIENRKSVLFERALLTQHVIEHNDYLYRVDSNYTFGTLYGDKTSWKKTVLTSKKRLKAIKNLLDKLRFDNLNDDLDKVCKSNTKRDWKYELINCPAAINFCAQKLIRYRSDNDVSLLVTTRMAGNHAELFSYCLYQKIKNEHVDIAPFIRNGYVNGIGSSKKPFGKYAFEKNAIKYELHLHYDHRNLNEGKRWMPHPYELKFFINKEEVLSESEYDASIVEKLKSTGFEWKGQEKTNKKGYWASAETDEELICIFKNICTELGK